MNPGSRKTAIDALPLEQTYRSLKEAFAQAIELEIVLARHNHKSENPARIARWIPSSMMRSPPRPDLDL